MSEPKVTGRPRGRPPGRTAADGVIAGREQLLDTAESLIQSEGPNVSLQAIATAAGVTKPTLYREVGDRDQLVIALAGRLSIRMANSVTNLVNQAKDPRDGLFKLVSAYLDLAATDRNLYLFITAGGNGDDRLQQTLLLADTTAKQFTDPISAYRIAQGKDPGVAQVWAYGLLGAMHYVTLWWLRDETCDKNLVADHLTSLLWPGMNS